MKGNRVRLNKLEGALTPQQAFLVWMEEAHQFQTMGDYARSLIGGPDSAWPLARLSEQVAKAVEQAMKGEPKEAIRRQVRHAVRDVYFLFYLHQHVNRIYLEQERYFFAQRSVLITGLNAMVREQHLQEKMRWQALRCSLELPYPVDPETAAAIDAARKHYVLPWEVLEEGDYVTVWLVDHYVAQGKTSLPEKAYLLVSHGLSERNRPLQEEVSAAFKSEKVYQEFLAGVDYSYGLADVTDAEFNAHYDFIVQEIRGLDLEGKVVELPTVPHSFLGNVPLVEGEWIDAAVVALAEWGARLMQKGYALEEPLDWHPLAWWRVVDPDGSDAVSDLRQQLWAQTIKHLTRFPGEEREIDGRRYLRWWDYQKWRGRRVKGKLDSVANTGLMLARWNQMVDTKGTNGTMTLAGVKMGRIECCATNSSQQVHADADEVARQLQQRELLLKSMSGRNGKCDQELRCRVNASRWREKAESYLGELYTIQNAIASIEGRYFADQPGLFPTGSQTLLQLIEQAQEMAQAYNRNQSTDSELGYGGPELSNGQPSSTPGTVDLSNLQNRVNRASIEQAAYLVDMAKAEALDAFGEDQAANQVVERYI